MAYRMIKRTPPRKDVSIIQHGKINHSIYYYIQTKLMRLNIIQCQALGYYRDYVHDHSQYQHPDHPGVSRIINREYNQPVGLRKYPTYWKRANQWDKRKKEANIFRLIKRSDTK